MDHLPPVENPWNPIQVPHFGCVYQGGDGDFETYPAQQGWNLEQLQRGIVEEDKVHDAASFLQEWLYFGLLASVLQVEIDVDKFLDIEEVDGELQGLWLTTKHLPVHMDEWKNCINALRGSEELLEYRREAIALLRFSYETWSAFDDFARIAGGDYGTEGGQAIALSICILGTTLEHALVRQQVIPQGSGSWKRAKSDFLVTRMLDAGWCPSVIEHIRSPLQNTVLYYASLLGPPAQPRGFSSDDLPVRHVECRPGMLECRRRVVSVYKTAHVDDECCCDFAGPDLASLESCLLSGGLPLVYWDDDQGKLHTTAYTPDKEYTAISHVWSDGMGNMTDNSLPVCRLKLITALVSSFSPTIEDSDHDKPVDEELAGEMGKIKLDAKPRNNRHYFWMDTLCVPVAPSTLAESTSVFESPSPTNTRDSLRKMAIVGMKEVYSQAAQVLVLDIDLLRIVGNLCEEEVLARIFASTWNRRLWTLQEYVLAKCVWYQFGDRSVKVYEEDEELDADWNNEILWYAKQRDLSAYARAKGVESVQVFGDTMKVMTVWSSLRHRSTKEINDVPLCISTLLDMDLAELLSVPASQRLSKHWSMYKFIPAGILMLPGRKQNWKSMKWAPLRMTDCVNIPSPTTVPMVRTPDGRLAVSLRGVLIGSIPEQAKRTVLTLDISGERWYVRQNLLDGNQDWSEIDFTHCEYAVIIGSEPMLEAFAPSSHFLVALVTIKSREADGGVVVEWLRAASMIKQGSPFDGHGQWTLAQLEEKKSTPISSTFTSSEQWWYIT